MEKKHDTRNSKEMYKQQIGMKGKYYVYRVSLNWESQYTTLYYLLITSSVIMGSPLERQQILDYYPKDMCTLYSQLECESSGFGLQWPTSQQVSWDSKMIGFAAPVVIIELPAPVSASAHRSFPVS